MGVPDKSEKDDKLFYDVKDIQRIFGIGRSKALELLKSEGFPTMKFGRTYRVNREELNTWIKENKGKSVLQRKQRKGGNDEDKP